MPDLKSQSPFNLSLQRVLIRNKDVIGEPLLCGYSRFFLYLNSTPGREFLYITYMYMAHPFSHYVFSSLKGSYFYFYLIFVHCHVHANI